ncbi:hypothetical protein TM7_0385 [candidate division TM7 genomosp. GTL1]|nr:hypothetical protein TM7_0385 [candidate division TM7 genomosp. GTL1]
MKKSILTEFLLYRYRYVLGYGLFIIAVVDLLFIAGTSIPGALTHAEMTSAVASANLPFTDILNMQVINLPYHLLQKVSLTVFGLTPLAIKLPSLLLALCTGVAFLFLLRRWFAQNVAILTAIVAVTASQFLIVSQNGTPTILFLFWPTFLLLTATGVSAASRFKFGWKLLFFAVAALSLYTPLSIYILGVMFVATLLHPHLRFMVRQLSRLKLTACFVVAGILLVPLALRLFESPGTVFPLLGVPQGIPTLASVWQGLQTMAHAFVGFTNPSIGPELLFPLYGIATSALVLLGLMRLVIDHHSARTYTIGLWSVVMAVVLILQPVEYLTIAFIPMLLMLAVGIDTLIREWYDLFPLNPYARAAALVPLVILLSGILYSGVDRFMNSYRYSTHLPQYFSTDLSLVRRELSGLPGNKVVVVSPSDKPFYDLLRMKDRAVTVTSVPIPGQTNIVANSINADSLGTPNKIVTSTYTNNSLRFLIYKTDQTVVQ